MNRTNHGPSCFSAYENSVHLSCQLTGQPVLIGGTMGTCSYVLTGTEHGMVETFGSTCHGAVSSCMHSPTYLYGSHWSTA